MLTGTDAVDYLEGSKLAWRQRPLPDYNVLHDNTERGFKRSWLEHQEGAVEDFCQQQRVADDPRERRLASECKTIGRFLS